MRMVQNSGALTVQAIAGTHVVLFGMSVDEQATNGLLGFSIERSEAGGEARPLDNFLLFKQNDKGKASDHSSETNPFQAFVWGDYSAEPDTDYSYRIACRYGSPESLTDGDIAKLAVRTESTSSGEHAVFFNRGAAASQAYATKFPELAGKRPQGEAAWTWLSRGLKEGLLAFIAQADGPQWSLRAAVYEFEYDPVLKAFAKAAQAGADVKIVWDDVDNSTPATAKQKAKEAEPAVKNAAAIKQAGIEALCIARTHTTQIPHNKFIVLLKNDVPQQVWTGSTNITDAGIFGQSNVGHIVRSPDVAADYLGYWQELSGDPEPPPLKEWTVADAKPPRHTPEELLHSADPRPLAGSIGSVFSPRSSNDALAWYGKLMEGASFERLSHGRIRRQQRARRCLSRAQAVPALPDARQPQRKD